ncbi:MAG TPA: cyclic nucleotide-binding domain-containing protein [bacterium]
MDQNCVKELKMFGELKDFEWEELAKLVIEKDFEDGDIIFNQGDESTELYILLKGAVDLQIKLAPQLGETTIYPVKLSEIFGEFAFLNPSPRSATARCMKRTTVGVIDKKAFDDLCKSFPNIGIGFYKYVTRQLIERLRRMNNYVRDVFVRSCGLEA